MKHLTIRISLLFLLVFTNIYSQLSSTLISKSLNEKKTLHTFKTDESIKIDGILDEEIWGKLDEATDFTMFDPGSGTPEPTNKKTKIKVTYTEEAIYIGAYLYDDNVKSIPMEILGRDNFGQADYLFVTLNPNNDGLNDVAFVVFSSGSQADAKVINGNEDFSWNAVWESGVKINDNGWVVEMKIPYLNLRFSNQENQIWGINFARNIQSLKEKYSWNFVDKTKGAYTLYAGLLTGVTKIDTPTRLSFYPYASASAIKFDGKSQTDYSVGLDIKYGINDSFTLDATLIPDFSQTDFDAVELNLGPFEQNYSEKRSFFNEGTELFSKGNLFYSRRIGGLPSKYGDIPLNPNETITDNPEKVTMLNAVKLSGRTKKGLGIGIFNAITEETEATVYNETDQTYRKVVTEPLANYSIIVLDQQFNKNSSVSFINTNVIRAGNFRDANVSGLIFDINNKKNTFNISGDLKMSSIFDDPENTENGFSSFLRLEKKIDNYQFEIGYFLNDDNFNINDLGFQRNNNFINYFAEISYRTFEPTKHFNSYRIGLEARTRNRLNPNDFTGNAIDFNFDATTLKHFSFGGKYEVSIGKQYDFYEPRTEGRFYTVNPRFEIFNYFSTDYRNKFALDARTYFTHRFNDSSNRMHLNLSPRYRFNNQFTMVYLFQYRDVNNENGYVNDVGNKIIFGERNSNTYTNSISGQYNFNTKSSLTLSLRHNWTPVKYDSQFYELAQNGLLIPNSYTANHDINYNSWNFDLKYNWEFAPGSQLTALYRNSIFNETSNAYLNFNENLDDLFNQPTEHLFSLRLVYYLDYNRLKNKNS
ncbi:MAG: carbohydrate binding family 9 domain-containing protein [Flavobacteriaceae bacterium]|nr:carbohydrate binding family 9 domain-containing protein [Flavobacteriaceae bacterium]